MFYFWKVLGKVLIQIISLRYKLDVRGSEAMDKDPSKKKGLILMPNHPALVDPLMLMLLFWPKYRIRPIVTEYIYDLWFLKPFMKLMKAVCVPTLTGKVNQLKVKRTKDAIQAVVDGLQKGDNFIFYPSGALKASSKEALAGSSGAHDVIQKCPDAHVVLARTTGLWGSSFSRAIEGVTPDLLSKMVGGLWTLLKNGIFFTPRRRVIIELAKAPENLPNSGDRLEFNHFLENWYNDYPLENDQRSDEEPLSLISYSFYRKDYLKEYVSEKTSSESEKVEVSDEVREKIYEEIKSTLGDEHIQIRPEMKLTTELGMDSLNLSDIIAFMSQEFKVQDVHPENLETVQDVLAAAEKSKDQKREEVKGGHTFEEEAKRLDPAPPNGETIMEAFLLNCQRMRGSSAAGDDVLGVMSYSKMKRASLVLASHFQKIEDTHIAVMLPASLGAYLVILGILFAGKIPVMINWTLGPKYIDAMLKISGAKFTISSLKFLERIPHIELGSALDNLLLLEEIKQKISLKTKLKGLILSFASPKVALGRLKIKKINPEDPAVILFTSGTESVPKGVPLSHKNILENHRALFQCFDSYKSDILYSILPPFHSFGFCVTGILPLLSGLRVAFFPDPTDSFSLAEGTKRWKITFFCSAPHFLKSLFAAAKPEELKTVRLFLSGAEKAPQELYNTVQKLQTNAKLIEGYGITECAPVISLNRFNLPPKGVGQLLPNVELRTIHPETEAPLKKGEEGEICVRGPNIFSGYLGSVPSPFIEIENEKWYKTGDIGYLDESDTLILSGRLKRFTKIGGEMISLGAIEETLSQELHKTDSSLQEGPSVAATAIEKENGKSEIVIFTVSNLLTKESANDTLYKSGLSRLIKVSKVVKIDEIPMLGTGKTNYRALKEKISETDSL